MVFNLEHLFDRLQFSCCVLDLAYMLVTVYSSMRGTGNVLNDMTYMDQIINTEAAIVCELQAVLGNIQIINQE